MGQDIRYTVSLDDSGFRAGLQNVLGGMQSMQARINGNFAQINNAFASLTRSLGVFTAALGVGVGVKAFTGLISETISARAHLNDLAEKTGATVEGLASMRATAKLTGTDIDSLASAMNRMSKNLIAATDEGKEAARALASIGLKASDLQGLSTDQQMLKVARALAQYKDDGNKAAVAISLLGKAGADALPFLKELAEEGLENAKVTAEQARMADELEKNLVRLRGATGQLARSVASELTPELAALTGHIVALKQAGASFIETFIQAPLSEAFAIAFGETLQQRIDATRKSIRLYAEDLHKAILGQSAFSADGIRAELAKLERQLEALLARQRAAALGGMSRENVYDARDASAGYGGKDSIRYKPAQEDEGGGASKEPSFMQFYDAALAQAKIAYAQEHDLREMSKQEELAFWRELTASYEVTTRDRVEISKRSAQVELEIMRQAAQQDRALRREAIDEAESAALSGLATEEMTARHQIQLGAMTKRELLALEDQFEGRRYEIAATAQAARIGLMQNDPNASEVALQAAQDRLLGLTRQFEGTKLRIKQEFAAQSNEEKAFAGMSQAFTQFTDSILSFAAWPMAARVVVLRHRICTFTARTLIGVKLSAWCATTRLPVAKPRQKPKRSPARPARLAR